MRLLTDAADFVLGRRLGLQEEQHPSELSSKLGRLLQCLGRPIARKFYVSRTSWMPDFMLAAVFGRKLYNVTLERGPWMMVESPQERKFFPLHAGTAAPRLIASMLGENIHWHVLGTAGD